jgi:hypothetical protein
MTEQVFIGEHSQIKYGMKEANFLFNPDAIASITTTFDASPQNCSLVDMTS